MRLPLEFHNFSFLSHHYSFFPFLSLVSILFMFPLFLTPLFQFPFYYYLISPSFSFFFILLLSALARSYQSCIACCRLVGCGFDFRSALGMQFVTFGMQLKMWFMRKHPSLLGMELKYPVYKCILI